MTNDKKDSSDLPFAETCPRYRSDRRRRPTRRPRPLAGQPENMDLASLERRRRKDRRATPRLELELGLEERVGAWRFFRTTADVSTFGVSTQQGTPHPLGTRLELRLHLPDGLQPLVVPAEVVGIRSQGGGLRLAFRDAPAEALRRIHRFVVARKNIRVPLEEELEDGEDTQTAC